MAISVADRNDMSLFINKECTNASEPTQSIMPHHISREYSCDSLSSQATIIDVHQVHNNKKSNAEVSHKETVGSQGNTFQIASAIYTLTQSQELKVSEPMEDSGKVENKDDNDSDDSIITDILVDKLLNLFDC